MRKERDTKRKERWRKKIRKSEDQTKERQGSRGTMDPTYRNSNQNNF